MALDDDIFQTGAADLIGAMSFERALRGGARDAVSLVETGTPGIDFGALGELPSRPVLTGLTVDQPSSLFAPSASWVPQDSLFGSQWHLLNTGQAGGLAGIDINVTSVWEDYTGAGVLVGVVDDGVEYTHSEFQGAYRTDIDYDYGGNDSDAAPGSGDSHGTAVAGLIGARNDGQGTVGVAFDSDLTGYRIFGGTVVDSEYFDVFRHHRDGVDIFSNSWGYNGFFYDDFDGQFLAAGGGIREAAAQGRDGLGSVVLFAAGNDRQYGQDVNYHSFQNARQTIAVAAIDNTGEISYYSTPGAAILIGAPSNGGSAGIVTTGLPPLTGSIC
jgi:subtilisin family serine protease